MQPRWQRYRGGLTMLAPSHRILFARCRHGEGEGGEVPVPAAHRDSDASTRPRFPRNRPSGDRLRPGARPRPCDQASDSREMEGPAVESSHWLDLLHLHLTCSHAAVCQCECSLPTPTGRLGRCRLLPSLRHQCIRLSIELPVDYARDSCSPARLASNHRQDRAHSFSLYRCKFDIDRAICRCQCCC